MNILSPEEMKQEVMNTLAMVENELCFGGNWEDARTRIDRCRSRLEEAQLAHRDSPDREKVENLVTVIWEAGGEYMGDSWEEFRKKYTDKIYALFPDIEQLDVLREDITKLNKKLDDREEDLIEAKRETRKAIGLFIKRLGFNNMDVDRLIQGKALKEEK